MILAIISAVIWSFSKILFKKSLWFWVNNFIITSYNRLWWIIIWLIFIATWFINPSELTLHAVWFWVLFAMLDMITGKYEQDVYRKETISAMAPFSSLDKVFIIIISFFYFKDISLLSLWITFLTIILISVSSFDFKKRVFPKNLWKIFLFQLSRAFSISIVWYLVLEYWANIIFMLDASMWFIVALIIVLLAKKAKEMFLLPKWFLKIWLWNWIIWWSSYWLSLLVIDDLWLWISTLLWFLWLWVTLIMSYIFFKDTPAKKDLLVTVLVTVLVWLWYYFK